MSQAFATQLHTAQAALAKARGELAAREANAVPEPPVEKPNPVPEPPPVPPAAPVPEVPREAADEAARTAAAAESWAVATILLTELAGAEFALEEGMEAAGSEQSRLELLLTAAEDEAAALRTECISLQHELAVVTAEAKASVVLTREQTKALWELAHSDEARPAGSPESATLVEAARARSERTRSALARHRRARRRSSMLGPQVVHGDGSGALAPFGGRVGLRRGTASPEPESPVLRYTGQLVNGSGIRSPSELSPTKGRRGSDIFLGPPSDEVPGPGSTTVEGDLALVHVRLARAIGRVLALEGHADDLGEDLDEAADALKEAKAQTALVQGEVEHLGRRVQDLEAQLAEEQVRLKKLDNDRRLKLAELALRSKVRSSARGPWPRASLPALATDHRRGPSGECGGERHGGGRPAGCGGSRRHAAGAALGGGLGRAHLRIHADARCLAARGGRGARGAHAWAGGLCKCSAHGSPAWSSRRRATGV